MQYFFNAGLEYGYREQEVMTVNIINEGMGELRHGLTTAAMDLEYDIMRKNPKLKQHFYIGAGAFIGVVFDERLTEKVFSDSAGVYDPKDGINLSSRIPWGLAFGGTYRHKHFSLALHCRYGLNKVIFTDMLEFEFPDHKVTGKFGVASLNLQIPLKRW